MPTVPTPLVTTASGGLFIGDKVRRDHRLAVARARRVEHAVGKRNCKQGPDGTAVGPGGANGRGYLAVKSGLLGQQPADDTACFRVGGLRWTSERILRHRAPH